MIDGESRGSRIYELTTTQFSNRTQATYLIN